MKDLEFRALLDLMMCSDPWPVDGDNQLILEKLIDNESHKRGYDGRMQAYHSFLPKEGNKPKRKPRKLRGIKKGK